MSEARVAFAVPVFNAERYLDGTLAALRAQTETRWVAYVTDNASTDATPEIVRRHADADPRIRYVRHATNVGANGNFNRSMARAVASGAPFVKWAAYDDLPHPGHLAACLAALDAAPSAVGAHTAIRLVDDAGDPYPLDPVRDAFRGPGGVAWNWSPTKAARLAAATPARRMAHFLREKMGEWLVYGVFRAETMRQTTPLAMPGVEDRFAVEMLLRGPLAFVPDVLFDHRLHGRSARYLSRADYIAYETGAPPPAGRLPSAGRAAAFADAIRAAPLRPADRLAAWAALGRFALSGRALRNLVVPGPDNYFGLGRRPPSSPAG